MEKVKVIKSEDNMHLIVFYNPEDAKSHGITESSINEASKLAGLLGSGEMLAKRIIDTFIVPYFNQNTNKEYPDYSPVMLKFMNIPGNTDLILPIAQFMHNGTECDHNCVQCAHSMFEICEEETNIYIQAFLKEQNIAADDSEEETVYDIIISVDRLNTMLDICSIIPADLCTTGKVYKYHDKYYIDFQFLERNCQAITAYSLILSEYGTMETGDCSYIEEQGETIVKNLIDLCNSLKTKQLQNK